MHVLALGRVESP